MKSLVISTLALLSFSTTALAGASSDPCTDPETVALNSWFLSINEGDASTKEGIMESLKLLATGGFNVSSVLGYDFSEYVSFVAEFDPTYWADPQRAEEAKETVLSNWTKYPGSQIRCNLLAFPAPAIGVRN